MDYVTRNLEATIDWLEGLSSEDLTQIHNEMCSESNMDDYISENDEDFFSTYFSNPIDAVRAVCYGNYEYSDKYVKFNGMANLESTDSPEDWVDTTELAEYVLDNERLFKHWVEFEEEEAELMVCDECYDEFLEEDMVWDGEDNVCPDCLEKREKIREEEEAEDGD